VPLLRINILLVLDNLLVQDKLQVLGMSELRGRGDMVLVRVVVAHKPIKQVPIQPHTILEKCGCDTSLFLSCINTVLILRIYLCYDIPSMSYTHPLKVIFEGVSTDYITKNTLCQLFIADCSGLN
jgi:hypothetical protein